MWLRAYATAFLKNYVAEWELECDQSTLKRRLESCSPSKENSFQSTVDWLVSFLRLAIMFYYFFFQLMNILGCRSIWQDEWRSIKHEMPYISTSDSAKWKPLTFLHNHNSKLLLDLRRNFKWFFLGFFVSTTIDGLIPMSINHGWWYFH